jgi:hypothetical protein
MLNADVIATSSTKLEALTSDKGYCGKVMKMIT